VVTTSYGSFNLNPAPGEPVIPINYGNGKANVTVNLRVSKTFGFGGELKPSAGPTPGQQPEHHGHGHGHGGFGSPHGMGGFFGPSSTNKRYNLTFTVTARNLFNTWNPGLPVGNLSSSMFGKTTELAGGPYSNGTASRRVDFQAVFSF
jgi:hypothetical protein